MAQDKEQLDKDLKHLHDITNSMDAVKNQIDEYLKEAKPIALVLLVMKVQEFAKSTLQSIDLVVSRDPDF